MIDIEPVITAVREGRAPTGDIVKLLEELQLFRSLDMSPREINRILDAYGRGMTIRTENALRLNMISKYTTNEVLDLVNRATALAPEQEAGTTSRACGRCGTRLKHTKAAFCECCGQCIDWSHKQDVAGSFNFPGQMRLDV